MPTSKLTAGSLFAGAGGLDLGFQRAGFETQWWVENNPDAASIMRKRFDGQEYGDIRDFCKDGGWAVDVVYGGDPCPKHSRARSSHRSTTPDLAGYFLAVVGRFRPKWVVRENVPSPSSREFSLALELLGYGAVIVTMDSAAVTGQSRKREYVVGRHQTTRDRVVELLPGATSDYVPARATLGTRQVAACLTTHRTRYDSRDNYIFEQGEHLGEFHLRIPDAEERENLAGFPRGWTDGFHGATRARLMGNSAVPGLAYWLASRIARSMHASGMPAKRAAAREVTEDDIAWATMEIDKLFKSPGGIDDFLA